MGEKYGMQKSDKVRFTLFVVLHIVLCASVFLCTLGLKEFLFSDFLTAQSDPTGLGDILNGLGFIFKGIITIALYVLCVAVMMLWSAFWVILLRFVALKEDTRVTGYEVKATLAVTIVGVILTLAAGIAFMGTEIAWVMGIMLVPIVILEITVYWIGLLGKKQSGDMQDISLENANHAAHIARFMVFVGIHIVLCMLVFRYAKQAGELGTVGGTDYTALDIADLLGGMLHAVVMLVWSAVLLTPLRLIAVRKNTRVTELEVKGTLAVAVVGIVLSLIMGVICLGLGAFVVMGIMFLPVLVLEIAMYWTGLREKYKNESHSA